MKNIIKSLAALLMLTMTVGIQNANAQKDFLQVRYKNGEIKSFETKDIESINFEYGTQILTSAYNNDTLFMPPSASYAMECRIISGDPVTIEDNCEWFDISLKEIIRDSTQTNHEYELYVNIAINDSNEDRAGTYKMKAGDKEFTKTVYQHNRASSFSYYGWDGGMYIPQKEYDITIGWQASEVGISILPGFGIKLLTYPQWIKEIECINYSEGITTPSLSEGDGYLWTRLTFATEKNMSENEQTGTIVLVDKDGEQLIVNVTKNKIDATNITSKFYNFGKLTGEGNHNDLLYPATMLFTDSRGMDLVSDDIGYNWFASSLVYSDVSWTNFVPYSIWTTAYNQIAEANDFINIIGTKEPTESHLKYYLAQALAIRAFNYYTLAQYFQHSYVSNERKPCVPIFTEANADSVNCQRATVAKVYEQIINDLDCAIELLSASSTARDDKRYVDLAVAYGLRARVNLVMNRWSRAASDAQNAITNTTATPYEVSDVDHPGFSDADDKSWMWGILVAETDRPVTSAICNFPSHMGSLNYGYASVGAWRKINKALYAQIPATDVRKGWWLDEEAQSPNLNGEQAAYVAETRIPAYTQMKFGCYQDKVYTSTNANDIPLMRVEEMYLILAEAQAMAGDPATGAATLEAFVKTYRDPAYTCASKDSVALTATQVQDKVWFQRRVELWGEGFSYADMMRLKKDMDRRGAGFEAHTTFVIPTGSDALLLPIPQDEIESNAKLTEADNNPTASTPEPVTE